MLNNLTTIHAGMYMNGAVFIIDGEDLYKKFQNNSTLQKGDKYIFRDLVYEGEHTEEIYSYQSLDLRSKALELPEKYYVNNCMKEIKDAVRQNRNIVLYFYNNMASRMNMLFTLAYLEQINYSKDVFFVPICNGDIRVEKIKFGIYNDLYKKIIVRKDFDYINKLKIDDNNKNAIKLYVEYQKENNIIVEYIKNNKNQFESDSEFLEHLQRKFAIFGIEKNKLTKMF